MNKLRLCIITPVFNEEQIIRGFYLRLKEVLEALENVESKILFVVDPCTDETVFRLREIISHDSRCSAIVMSSRFGHQKCLLAGIEASVDMDAIIMMDCDLQHPPELIPILVDNFNDGADVVYTVRTETQEVSLPRKIAGNFFYYLLNILSQININSNSADFRLISQRVARTLVVDFKERDLFLRGIFSWIGFKQIGVEFIAERRGAGNSKYSVAKIFGLGLSGIMSFSTKPLKIGIFIGLGFAFCAFLLLLWSILAYFLERSLPSGWTTIIVVSLLFSGIQLIVLGIIGAYIGGIYEEVKNRPRYIIEEKIENNE